MPVDDRSQQRIQTWLLEAYKPEIGTGVPTDERLAKAMEYSAYHLHQISEKLSRLIDETNNLGGLITLISDSGEKRE